MGDKKKRGESGKSNAENIPFRYGSHNAHAPQNAAFAVPARKYNRETGFGLIGGLLAAKLGFGMPDLSVRLSTWFDDNLATECPIVSAHIDMI